MTTPAQLPDPETIPLEKLVKWEVAPSWGMIWEHYLSFHSRTLLTWLDKSPLYLRQMLALKAMELSRKWSELGMPGPEGLVEAFQILYPAPQDQEVPSISSVNAERLSEFFESLNT